LGRPITAYWEGEEANGHVDRNTVAIHHHHRSLGHRQIVREDTHRIFLRGIQFDDYAGAEPQHLVD
jgi:hypothetical protein